MCFHYKLILYEEMGNGALIFAFIFVEFVSNPTNLSKLYKVIKNRTKENDLLRRGILQLWSIALNWIVAGQ